MTVSLPRKLPVCRISHSADQKYMENAYNEGGLEYLDDLCLRYREMERSKAMHLDVCDLILSTDGRRREWVPSSELAFEGEHNQRNP